MRSHLAFPGPVARTARATRIQPSRATAAWRRAGPTGASARDPTRSPSQERGSRWPQPSVDLQARLAPRVEARARPQQWAPQLVCTRRMRSSAIRRAVAMAALDVTVRCVESCETRARPPPYGAHARASSGMPPSPWWSGSSWWPWRPRSELGGGTQWAATASACSRCSQDESL